MRRSPVLSFSSLALGLVLAAGALPAQQGFDLKDKIPPETILYASFPDIMQSVQDFQSMPLAKLWKEEEVKEFLAQPLAFVKSKWPMVVKQLEQLHKQGMLPVTPDELLSLRPGSLSAALIGPGGKGEPFRFAFTVGFAQGAEVMDKLVQQGMGMLQAQIKNFKEQGFKADLPQPCKIGGALAVVQDTTKEGGPFDSLTFAYQGGLFLVASSKSLAEKILGNQPTAGLSRDPLFQKTFAKMKAQGAETLFFFRPKACIQAVMRLLPALSPEVRNFLQEHGQAVQDALNASGLMGAQAMAAAATYDQGKCYWDSYLLAPAPRKGFLNLTGDRNLNLDHLAWIPKKVSGFSMGILPVKKIVHTLLNVINAADPEVGGKIAQIRGQLKKRLGMDVVDDFLNQLGGEVLSYGFPQTNIMGPPSVAVLVQVDQPDKFLDSLETLLGLTQGMVTLEAKKDQATGLDIWEVQFDLTQLPPRASMILANLAAMMKPSFTFHKGFLVGGLSPRDVKKAVAQMDGKRKGDVRSRKDVALFLASLPPKVRSLSFSDIKTTIQTVYEAATGALNMVNLPEDIPLDLALLPGADTVAKHFFPVTSYSTETEEGFFSRTVSPFGPEILLGAGAVGAGVGVFAVRKAKAEGMAGPRFQIGPRTQKKPKRVPLPEEAVPALPEPPKAAPAQIRRVMEDFDLLSSGLVIYKVETGAYPDSLETLLKPTKDYPNGFLPDRKALPKDPWGRPYRYRRTASGYRLWSLGPNGKDEGGKGDDILRAR